MDKQRREILDRFGSAFENILTRQTTRRDRATNCLVCIYQRGAMDGLSAVVPYLEDEYYARRPQIAVAPPGEENGALDLNGFFGLHPALAALMPIYEAGELAIVHAAGLASSNRSHFDAQRRMESGDAPLFSGWLGRHLSQDRQNDSVFRVISIAPATPFSVAGEIIPLALPDFNAFSLLQNRGLPFQNLLYELHANTSLAAVGSTALDAVASLEGANPAEIPVENDAQYPNNGTGRSLQRAAQLIKADLGTEVICIDTGGWDTHSSQNGRIAGLFRGLAEAMAAFTTDLGERMSRVNVMTMSEFGRTTEQNSAQGTDHGWGNAMFVLGGGVRGGRVYGDWPGMGAQDLDARGDLPVTTDFRQVLYELLERRLNSPDPAGVFPQYRQASDLRIFR